MAAVAQRSNAVQTPRVTHSTQAPRRTRSRRRPNYKFRNALKCFTFAVAIAMLFGWVSVHARITVTGYNRSRLTDLCREERLKNQRLKVQWDSLSSPHNVVAAAERSGMVYAAQYDYIHGPQAVASAAR
ncbi:MAG: hypothetical protein ABFD54_16695 [Armatimonadota bacterium]|nr:hypothetical protein [bacterium]